MKFLTSVHIKKNFSTEVDLEAVEAKVALEVAVDPDAAVVAQRDLEVDQDRVHEAVQQSQDVADEAQEADPLFRREVENQVYVVVATQEADHVQEAKEVEAGLVHPLFAKSEPFSVTLRTMMANQRPRNLVQKSLTQITRGKKTSLKVMMEKRQKEQANL